MTPVWLSLRAGLRRGWRPWLALALLLGVMGAVVLTAAAGARRTDTAYPRLLRWANASDVQILPTNVASPGYFQALRSLPQVSAMSTGILLNFAIKIHGHYLPSNHVSVYASPDGRLDLSIDRVKILTGRFLNPADPRSAVIDKQMAADQHVAPGGTIRLFVVPNDRHGNPLLSRAYPVTFHVAGIAVFDNEIVPGVTGGYPTALLSPAFLRTAVARRVTNSGVGAFIRLRPGVAVATFLLQASALAHRYPSTGGIADVSPAGEIVTTERAIRPYAVALALFAALAGIITLMVIGQLLGRQVIMDAAEFPILRALGMTRSRLAALSLARAGAVTVLGACLAVGAAIAASPLTPIGPARLAEPTPGIAVNVAILGTGLALIILLPLAVVAPAAWHAAGAAQGAEGLAEPTGLPRVSRLASALSVAGSVTGGSGCGWPSSPAAAAPRCRCVARWPAWLWRWRRSPRRRCSAAAWSAWSARRTGTGRTGNKRSTLSSRAPRLPCWPGSCPRSRVWRDTRTATTGSSTSTASRWRRSAWPRCAGRATSPW
jgi:hypothetical protein